MQSKCTQPERVLVGHPFNPPHIIPLVEVVGGTETSPAASMVTIADLAAFASSQIFLERWTRVSVVCVSMTMRDRR